MWDFENYKEDTVDYVSGVHDNLKVKIVNIKHHFDNKNKVGESSPFTNVCFRVMDGDESDKLLNERFYCVAKFKMAWLATACGIYEEVDGKKVVPPTFRDPMTLAKRELYISTKKSSFNPKYTEIDQMSSQPIFEVEHNAPESVY